MKKLFILICIVLWGTNAAFAAYSGTTGDCNWHYNSTTKALTISGNGFMAPYGLVRPGNSSDAPWFSYRNNIQSVEINNGVKSIGAYAFYGCERITSVTIPVSVKSIGECAFYSCSSLTSVIIPDSVTNLWFHTFARCTSLTSVTIPSRVTNIDWTAFQNCSGLRNIKVGWTTPPTWFLGADVSMSSCTLVVPAGTVSNYKSKDPWKNFSYIAVAGGLKSLSIAGYNLSPAFNSDITNYSLTVPNDTSSIQIAAAVAWVNDMVATSDTGSFNVNYGANTFPIHVTAEDGGQKTYTVTIQRGIYTIAFTGEGINSIATQNRNYGTVVTKPATPYRYGYTFEGWYNGEAEYDFDTPVTDNLTLTAKWKPIITFDWFSSKTYGDAPFTLTATSPSPMPIVYTSSNESVATISGNTVTITGAGQTDITANQAGNTNYNAAIPVTYTLFVNSNGSAITFGELPAKTYGDAPFELSASSTAAEPITFISSDENVASISGTTVTIHKANNVQITATQAGGAATFTRTLKINKATLTITANDTSMIYGDPIPSSFTCQYTGFVNGDTESVLTTPPTIYCYAYSWSNVGDYDIEPYGANAGNYSFVYQKGKVTVNKANQVIAWENDTTVTYGEVSYLNLPYYYTDKWNYITYTSDNEDVASISGGYVHIQKAGTAHITATQAGDENYNAATPITHTVTVNKANQVIVWDDEIPTFTYGEVSYLNLPYYTDKWNNITYTSDNEDVATAGNYVYLHNAGTAHITATQAGDDNYNAAAPVSRTLVIEKAPLTVTAENKTRRQGEANPGFTLSYNGFKNNETESVLDVLPSITCAANANSPVGFYAIVLSGGSDNNYAYNLVNGRLEVMATTDINNIENKSISIYPNPAKQYLYIQSESPVQKIEIYDQIGKLVHIESNIAERIDISSLSEGLYLVRIYGNDWVNTQKIMVVR